MRRNGLLGSMPRLVRAAVLAAGATVLLGGCSSDLKQRADLLEQENAELRSRNDQLNTALSDAESKRMAAESELEKARNARAMAPAGAPRGGAGTDYGFTGLDGVSTSMRAGDVVVDVAGDVLFDSGKATLKSSAKKTLDSIAGTLQSRYSGKTIRIAGHTDSDPIKKSSWKTNERLSAERALAVEEYLASKGIPKDRMYSAAYGPADPKSSKKESRRVEIVILAQGN